MRYPFSVEKYLLSCSNRKDLNMTGVWHDVIRRLKKRVKIKSQGVDPRPKSAIRRFTPSWQLLVDVDALKSSREKSSAGWAAEGYSGPGSRARITFGGPRFPCYKSLQEATRPFAAAAMRYTRVSIYLTSYFLLFFFSFVLVGEMRIRRSRVSTVTRK